MKRLLLMFLILWSIVISGQRVYGKDHYVPEPKPIKSDIEITAFYYPGTDQMAEWDMVRMTLPRIKPLLGWYDEGNPEVIDWQIKWAVEHGISTFFVDWYWNKGERRLEHWVQGFYKARYRSCLKWAVMWANHNEKGAHSEDDLHKVTQFWLENYFKTPEYYRIDDKPVVIIYNDSNIDNDIIAEAEARGETLKPGEGIQRGLSIINNEVKKAGLKGVYFIAVYHGQYNSVKLQSIQKAGFDATVVYNYSMAAYWNIKETEREGLPKIFPFEYVTKTNANQWSRRLKMNSLPFFPVIGTGWNDQPRSFQDSIVLYDRTPEQFRTVCEEAKTFCKQNGINRITIAPINEWQEGTYIEPNEEYGFKMYDVLRDVFCVKPKEGWPKNVTPGELGLGPYDYPETKPMARTSWEFKNSPEGWYRQPYGTGNVVAENGCLRFRKSAGSSINRAAIRTVIEPFNAYNYPVCTIRMKITPQKTNGLEVGQIFWGSTNYPLFDKNLAISIDNSVMFPVKADGLFHEYQISMKETPFWRGMINHLWFNPVNYPHDYVEIDYIRFQSK